MKDDLIANYKILMDVDRVHAEKRFPLDSEMYNTNTGPSATMSIVPTLIPIVVILLVF